MHLQPLGHLKGSHKGATWHAHKAPRVPSPGAENTKFHPDLSFNLNIMKMKSVFLNGDLKLINQSRHSYLSSELD